MAVVSDDTHPASPALDATAPASVAPRQKIGRYIQGGTLYETDATNASCPTLPAFGMPRCSLAEVARRARDKGIDLAKRSEISFAIQTNLTVPRWSVRQSKPKPAQAVFADDC